MGRLAALVAVSLSVVGCATTHAPVIAFEDALGHGESFEETLPEVPKYLARRPAKSPWGWPLDVVMVTSEFGERIHPIAGGLRFHAGVDLSAEDGERVLSAGKGVVVFAGWSGGHGKRVDVRHRSGWFSSYSHLSMTLVREGESVDRGDLIGLVGSTGVSTGPHLHFEVRRNGTHVDPLAVLPSRVRGPMASR